MSADQDQTLQDETLRGDIRLESLGYKQQLNRSLRLVDLLVYGLVFIAPTSPWGTFGIVFNASHGMVPLVYIVGLVAMMFTALSYMTMSAEFPVAGSVYAYAGRGIGESIGFLAGWALLLDYLLSPTWLYLFCAVSINAVLPWLPKPILVVTFLALNTAISLSGIDGTARLNKTLLSLQLLLLSLFTILALVALSHHINGAHLTLRPLFDAHKVNPSLVFGALSLAVVSFLGFDAISTLTEEAKGGARAVGRATILCLLVSAALFIGQTYLASLFVLSREHFADGDQANTAFLAIAQMVGGETFRFWTSILGVLFAGLAAALAAQTATARLLFSMARDGKFPKALAHVDAKHQTPSRAILLTAGLTLVLGVSLADQFELITSMVNFGALTGFLALHLSVMIHFMLRRRSRRWIRHLIVPATGFAIIAYVLINAQLNAKITGLCWMSVGLLAVLVFKVVPRSTRAPVER